MFSIFISSFQGRLRINNVLILFVTLCTIGCQSFLIKSNSHYFSNYITKNAVYNPILYSYRLNFKCNNVSTNLEGTHLTNDKENLSDYNISNNNVENPSNLLSFLSCYDDKFSILQELIKLIGENKLDTKLLYVSPSHHLMLNMYGILNDYKFKHKINLISKSITNISKDTYVTFADVPTLMGYYNYFNNDVPFEHPETVKYINRTLKNKTSVKFEEDLKSIIGNFLMDNDQISNEQPIKNSKFSIDKDFLTSIRNWTDQNYIENKDLVEVIKNFSKKKGIVILDNFDLFYDNFNRTLKYTFDDSFIALLNKDCSFVGFTSLIYNPLQVKSWLTSIFGPFKVVSMSKSPKFRLLSSYGYLSPFVETDEPDCKNLDKVNQDDIKELYKYMGKKNNLVNMKNINPDVKTAISFSIQHALKSKGIDTYNKLLHHSTDVRDILKDYDKELKLSPNYENSPNKIPSLLSRIINLEDNNVLAKLHRALYLYPIIKRQQNPSVDYLTKYIISNNLYPTVIYRFADNLDLTIANFYNYFYCNDHKNIFSNDQNYIFEDDFDELQLDEFMKNVGLFRKKLFELGICVVLKNDDTRFKRFAQNNTEKFKIFLTNFKFEAAPHYIIIDSLIYMNPFEYPDTSIPIDQSSIIDREQSSQFLCNSQLYSLTQGAKLVTLTMDSRFTIHTLKSILSPIYSNFNKIEHPLNYFHKIHDVLKSRLFSSYLGSCIQEYYKEKFDHFQKKEYHDKLEEYFEKSNLDTIKLIKLQKKNKRLLKYFKIVKYIISRKLYLKSILMNYLNYEMGSMVWTILGIDGLKYKILYSNEDIYDVLAFSNEDGKNFINVLRSFDKDCYLLQNIETKEYIITDIMFIKDVLSIERNNMEIKKIVINSTNNTKLIINNDLEDYIDIIVPPINIFNINSCGSFKNVNLSTIIPSYVKEDILNNIEEYKKNNKMIEEIYKKADKMKRYKEENGKNSEKGIETLFKDYLKLKGDLKRDKMEHILKENRIIRSFWGKYQYK